MAAKIKKGDKVVVIAGKDKGKTGRVLRVIPDEGRVVVEGVAMVKKHQRQQGMRQSGIVTEEAAIHISNVAISDPNTGEASRVGFKIDAKGAKTRIAKKSGAQIDERG